MLHGRAAQRRRKSFPRGSLAVVESRPSLRGALAQAPFLACVIVLLGAVVLAGPVARTMKVVLRKDPVPLRRPLGELDKSALGEYQFEAAAILDHAMLDPLGTEEYIDWYFTDTSVQSRRNPLRYVHCFITYYTGKPDLVPHVAEVCYLGQGYDREQVGDLTVAIRGVEGERMEVPVRAVTFVKSDVFQQAKPTVVYTFHCNGAFVETRDRVRLRLADPRDRGAYYCKIEVTFGRAGSTAADAAREEVIPAATKFLTRLLPVLLRDHMPDWKAVQQGQPTT